MNKVLIIAEAGVNHNGQMELALKLIDAAAEAGADIVKFQTFRAENLVSKKAPRASYQKDDSGSNTQFDMLKKLELDEAAHQQLVQHCRTRGIAFLSTPFDMDSIDLLEKLKIDTYKIPSGEITNLPYLRRIGAKKKRVILSTGMAEMSEIGDAIAILESAGTPRGNIVVLHCNTEYPTPMEDVNLRAMISIKETYNVKVGYSDHTLGIEVPIAAVALGAEVIEKHFTLDKTLPGPDHKASLDSSELRQMVAAIRNIEKAMGDGIKKASPSEQKNKPVGRKSIHLGRDVKKGEILKEELLQMKRPGDGISPMQIEKVLNRAVNRDLPEDHKLDWDDLS